MTKEFNLSDYAKERERGYGNVYAEKYVKKFIKELKKKFRCSPRWRGKEGIMISYSEIEELIDKLAGDKLK